MTNRNHSIDVLKLGCAGLIVVLHSYGVTFYPTCLQSLTRCAVPCFFMISGYLLYNNGIEWLRLKRNAIHILRVLLWSTFFYAIVKEVLVLYHDGVLYIPSMKEWIYCLLLNANPFGIHLWYLQAYLCVLLAIAVVNKYNLWKWAFSVVPLLFLCNIFFGSYGVLLFGRSFPMRNFLFTGFPCFVLGAYIKANTQSNFLINKRISIWGG